MRIQNNIPAQNTHRMYAGNNSKISRSAEKLSSGYRINRAADDAAGLAISEKMRSQIRGLNRASSNSQDAISLIQTAEGAMAEIHSMLQRMNELAVQSATGTNEDFDRSQISAEFDQLKSEINDVAGQTTFNDMYLLDGSLAGDASAVEVTTGSALAVHNTFKDGDTPTNKFTVTRQSGLSSQTGAYSITRDDAKPNEIIVSFKDGVTQDVTNTTIDLAKVVTGDFKPGGAFKLDLSASGMGVFELSADQGADVSAENLGKALASASTAAATDHALTTRPPTSTISGVGATPTGVLTPKYEGSQTAPAGKYTLSVSGSNVTVTDEDGYSATVAATGINPVDDAEHTLLDLSNLSINGKTIDLGSYKGTSNNTNTVTAGNVAAMFDGVSITMPEHGGTGTGGLKIQIGTREGDQTAIQINALNTKALGLSSSTISDQEAAGKAITAVRNAVNLVSEQRATLGAVQNRMEHKISNLDNTSENLAAAESRIRDVDMAKEMTEYTKNNILSQAATSMLAQANSAPQGVLSLLQQ